MACEMAEQDRLWEMVEIISTGKMPEGHSADDLRALGLPLPGEIYRETQPDGSVIIKQHSPKAIEDMKKKSKNAFACDTPQ
jgi:hypothetical protein